MEIKSSAKFRLKEDEESADIGADSEIGAESLAVSDNNCADTVSVDLPVFSEEFEVLCEIGRGGMGCVYKAKEKSTGTVFAIKTLNLDLANDAVANKRFEQEAEAASKLNHPNLVAVYGHGTTGGTAPYIVMDYLEGQSLADLLSENKFLDPNRALDIFLEIADGLMYAHNHGVVHRDIKPTSDTRQIVQLDLILRLQPNCISWRSK